MRDDALWYLTEKVSEGRRKTCFENGARAHLTKAPSKLVFREKTMSTTDLITNSVLSSRTEVSFASTSPLATHCHDISPFLAMEVMDYAQTLQKEGKDIIRLEIGEPDFATPQCVVDVAKKALDNGMTHYTSAPGTPALRNAVANYYLSRYNVRISAEQVFVFPGSSIAMMLLFGAMLHKGDEVIISNPAYACYPNFVRYAGGTVRSLLTYEENGFQYEPEDVEKALTQKTKAIFCNSPSNPTGIVMEAQRLQALADIVDARASQGGPLLVSDEIYHGLTYEGSEHCILEFTKQAIVVGGFSKAYAMTGWRLGYLIVPENMIRPLTVLMQNFMVCTNAMVQEAGVCALQHACDDVAAMCAEYNRRRLYVLGALRDMGFSIPVDPRGAFYVLFNAKKLAEKHGGSSVRLAYDIVDKAQVALTPGIDFGSQAEGFLRLSYANSLENIQKAMDSLAKYMKL